MDDEGWLFLIVFLGLLMLGINFDIRLMEDAKDARAKGVYASH